MTEGLMTGVFIFVLALFAGFEVITKVPPTLHTPLMSGANAISGITLIGALLALGPEAWNIAVLLAAVAAGMASVYEMDAINPAFENSNVVLVVVANDIVNPAARHDRASTIFGMPILNVDKAGRVLVIKRSLSPGFAGVES